MALLRLEKNGQIEQNVKLSKAHKNLQSLLEALQDRGIADEIAAHFNKEIEEINKLHAPDKKLLKKMRGTKNSILKFVEKEHKLVPKHYYRNLWMALGMTVFGIPMGIAFSTALGNFAFLAIGLPIGMPIGMAVGSAMDNKALQEGRQLDIEFEY